MKVSLVVASGTHQGKVIPIGVPQFLIGREPQCNLRPASQAISKKHCGIITRDGKVFVADYGSTNGTLVNDTLIKGEEIEVEDGVSVMVGPLDFTLRVEHDTADSEGTPFPNQAPEALAAVKAVAAAANAQNRDNTPAPKTPAAKPSVSTGSKESPALTGSKESPALKAAAKPAPKPETPPAAAKPTPTPPKPSSKIAAPSSGEQSEDELAAMLLGMDDGEDVPDGSTVMEMPVVFSQDTKTGAPTPPKPEEKKKATSREDMTNAANDILRKMRRRPT